MDRHEHIVEIPELFSNRIYKRLIFRTEGLYIEKPFSFNEPQFIPAEEINGFRLGIRWMRGLYFVLSRQFTVELKHQTNCKTRIRFSSFYTIRNQQYDEKWSAIVELLYHYYISSQLQLYIELHQMGQAFTLSGLTFYSDGIVWEKNKKLAFRQVAISTYRSYFVIYNSNNPRQQISFNFLNNWNAYLIQSLLKHIVEENERILSR